MRIVSFRVKNQKPRSSGPRAFSLGAWLKGLKKRWQRAPGKKKRLFCFAVALAAVLALLPFSTPGKAVMAAAGKRDLPIYCVQKDSKVVALSFDAAWGNEDTQQLIDILGKYKVQATFFVVGEWVDKYPESVRALCEAGHEIMNHSDDHAHYPKLSPQQITQNLEACNDKIEAITGVRPTLFRPPYGDYNDKVVSTVREAGMYTIQWDVDSMNIKTMIRMYHGLDCILH